MGNNYLDGELRNPHTLILSEAFRRLNIEDTDESYKVLYGIYCEALTAVRKSIQQGAQAGDLEKAIENLGAFKHRLTSE